MSNVDRLKKSYLVLHDRYVFGSGYYYSLEEKMDGLIDDAIELYDKEGIESLSPDEPIAIAHYMYVIDPLDPPGDATVVASQAKPNLVGRLLSSFESVSTDMTYEELVNAMQ